jgi:iron complex transport system substrate-binding protein
MKTKTLIVAGIAVCVLFLTSPALASAGYSKIYGNANEDDVLDMRDVTYIKLVIFEKKPATTFADANNDGKISMLDVGQTKLIILGKEKRITFIDMAGRAVTVPRPIERAITLMPPITRLVIGLGAEDKIVGMGDQSHFRVPNQYDLDVPKWQERFAELREVPNVGSHAEPNLELILSLEPDVIIAYSGRAFDVCDKMQEDTGIPVVAYKGGATCDAMFEEIKFVGAVLGKDREAEEINSYFNEVLDKVTEVTSEIPENEKPRVYFPWGSVITKASMRYEPVELAGGILVSKDCAPPTFGSSVTDVSIEQIIAWNPDIFLVMKARTSDKQKLRLEDVLSDPRLQTTNAVKNRKAYYTPGAFYLNGADHPKVIIETLIMAKHFHPEEFEDLDVAKEGNELFERFYGADGLWTELGGILGFI